MTGCVIIVSEVLSVEKVTLVQREFLVKAQLKEIEDKKEDEKALIDRNIGLEYCSGMEDIYREVLEAYYEEGQQYSEKMIEYQKNRDWKNYAIVVHAIKSTSLTIGATELSAAAKEQEMAAKAGDEETIFAKWEAVYAAYQEVLEEVKNMLA